MTLAGPIVDGSAGYAKGSESITVGLRRIFDHVITLKPLKKSLGSLDGIGTRFQNGVESVRFAQGAGLPRTVYQLLIQAAQQNDVKLPIATCHCELSVIGCVTKVEDIIFLELDHFFERAAFKWLLINPHDPIS